MWQKQVIDSAVLHFGLGPRTAIDVARVVWPNGVPQAEFGIGVKSSWEQALDDVRAAGGTPYPIPAGASDHRLSSGALRSACASTPRTPGITQTEDWVRLRGDQLAPRNGRYDVRITAELWETHFLDHVSLLVVDHPADTETFVDERFSAASPPRLAVQALRTPRPVTGAMDDQGRDVTALVSERDGRYLATFGRGTYQGIAEPHAVEFELPAGVPTDRPLVLVAEGWVSHRQQHQPGRGRGAAKRVGSRSTRRTRRAGGVRWCTTWGSRQARTRACSSISRPRTGRAGCGCAPTSRSTGMACRWPSRPRGGCERSVWRRPARSCASAASRKHRRRAAKRPETPDYARTPTRLRWRDLVGYHTRFGEVGSCWPAWTIDVIMNAGDELRLVPRAAAPAAGWRRDFVLIGDGWEKDGLQHRLLDGAAAAVTCAAGHGKGVEANLSSMSTR